MVCTHLALHSSAAYVASVCGSDGVIRTPHLEKAVTYYNTCVAPSDSLPICSLEDHTPTQKHLSDTIHEMQFNYLLNSCSIEWCQLRHTQPEGTSQPCKKNVQAPPHRTHGAAASPVHSAAAILLEAEGHRSNHDNKPLPDNIYLLHC